ncbi:hypothetical protein GCM10011414_06600 [Croceivirga lutea]|nr:hypothetical protein GCM10011414_06600 [Croceivirga lutea]
MGVLLFSCSTDSDGDEPMEEIPVNARPVIEDQSFEVLETIGGFIEIGQIEAVDPEGGALKYFIESDYPLAVNLNTGVLSTVAKNVFDY